MKFELNKSTAVALGSKVNEKNMYFSIVIQVTESYFKFLSYKLVAYQTIFTGSVISE